MSAALHPIRELALKGQPNPISAYLGVTIAWIAIATLHAVLSGQALLLATDVWPLAILSAAGLATYYYGTLTAMRLGNLSVYYPIIRSSPLAIVAFSWVIFDQSYSGWTLLGIGLIIVSGLAIQKSPGSLFENPKAMLLAILAMTASAVYAMADASAMQHATPATFLIWNYILVSIFLATIALNTHGHGQTGWRRLTSLWLAAPARILLAALSSYACYYLILMAFQLAADPAAVSALRQASIPLSVILAAIMLHEPKMLRQLKWASLLALGIVIIVWA